jgi:enoyl-[acyl-carrier protein] reductase III
VSTIFGAADSPAAPAPAPPAQRKVALVTGASRGIGRAIAVELADAGYDVVVNYLRHDEAARETQRLVEERGGQAWLAPANIGEPDEIKALFAEVRRRPRLDAVIHNAALGTFKDLLRIRPNQLELAFRVNALALLWLAQESWPLLAATRGSIVALSSLGSTRVVPHYGIVGPSKAALESLVRYLAVELRPRGVTVNAVSGGFMDTDALRAFPDWEALVDQTVARTPGGRIGEPADMARVVRALVCGRLDWVCGQVILADGGFTLP